MSTYGIIAVAALVILLLVWLVARFAIYLLNKIAEGIAVTCLVLGVVALFEGQVLYVSLPLLGIGVISLLIRLVLGKVTGYSAREKVKEEQREKNEKETTRRREEEHQRQVDSGKIRPLYDYTKFREIGEVKVDFFHNVKDVDVSLLGFDVGRDDVKYDVYRDIYYLPERLWNR